jgi:hypothetical protein
MFLAGKKTEKLLANLGTGHLFAHRFLLPFPYEIARAILIQVGDKVKRI